MRNSVEPFAASRRFTGAIAGSIVVGCLATLTGWLIDSPILKSLLPGRVAMNPSTALALVGAAVSLGLTAAGRARNLARLSASVVAALGAACVACYWAGVDSRIDRVLFASALGDNRMAPNTGVCLFLAGTALLTVPQPRGRRIAEALGSALACWSFLSVIGYLFGSRSLYGIGAYIPMALNTALLLHLLGLGVVLAAGPSWLASVIDTNTPGAIIARRLMPAAVAVPLVFGWLRLRGEAAKLYDTQFGAALLVVATIVVLLSVVVWAAKSVDRAVAHSAAVQAASRAQEIQYRLLVAGVQDYAIFLLDPEGNVSTWNEGAQRIKRYKTAEILGRHFSRFYPAEDLVHGKPLRELAQAVKQGRVCDEGWRVRADGTRFWANTVITAIFDDNGKLTGFSKITRDMSAEKDYQQRLADLNDDLERRVELRTRELAEANRDLAEQNRENETFVYSVSHDLRSPLVNLQGFSAELELTCGELAETLSAADVPAAVRECAAKLIDPAMKEPIHFIRTAVTRLSAIIDALLRLSRAGRVEFQIRDVDLNEVVQRIIDAMRATLAARGAEIILHPLPAVRGDATALEQVFANLIGNAVNYLDPARQGEIEVGVFEEAPATDKNGPPLWTCFVRDSGLGIAAPCQNKVFQAFQRLHPAAARGEGMGLTIVRRVVERHGGRIWLESTENVGSTFFVSLPAADASGRNPTSQAGRGAPASESAGQTMKATRQEGLCHAH
ncbi:MAG TPA: ATP-binding protein [Pirellulales bacterium]|nr:ATP-binding protein [Pirellulales bacterium]